MVKNVKALMTMLCCIGLVSVIPACCWRDKDKKDNGYRREKVQKTKKHTKKEIKTVKQDSSRPGAKKMKTVESVETSSSY
jgi:hypothetical protein